MGVAFSYIRAVLLTRKKKCTTCQKNHFYFSIKTSAGGCFTRSTSPDLQPAATWHHPALCPLKHNRKLKLSRRPSRTEQTRPAGSWWINKNHFWDQEKTSHKKMFGLVAKRIIYIFYFLWDRFFPTHLWTLAVLLLLLLMKQRSREAAVSIGDMVHLSRRWSIHSFNFLMAALTLWPCPRSPAQIVFKWLGSAKLSAPLITLVSGGMGRRLLLQPALVWIHCAPYLCMCVQARLDVLRTLISLCKGCRSCAFVRLTLTCLDFNAKVNKQTYCCLFYF